MSLVMCVDRPWNMCNKCNVAFGMCVTCQVVICWLIGVKLPSGCVVPGSWSLSLAVEKVNFEGGC